MRKFILIALTLCSRLFSAYSQETELYNYDFALIEASRQKTFGNLDEAVQLYKKCIEVRPDVPVPYYELGSVYASMEKNEDAESNLAVAYKLDRDNYWYILAYAQVLMLNKHYKEAISVVQDYLKKKSDLKLKYIYATAHELSGKSNKALKILNEIEREKGLSEVITMKKVNILKTKKEYKKGKEEIQKLIDILPESPDYKIIMGEYLQEIGWEKQAVSYFRNAYQLDSSNLYAITNLADYYNNNAVPDSGIYFLSVAYQNLGIDLQKKITSLLYLIEKDKKEEKDIRKYTELFKALNETYPDNLNVKLISYDFYNSLEDYQTAYQIILEVVQLDNENIKFWEQAVYNASLLNRPEEIIRLSLEALKKFPNNLNMRLFLGIGYFQSENYDSSFLALKQIDNMELESGARLQLLTFLGESAYRIDSVEVAFQSFEDLLLLKPDDYMVMNNYAYYMSLRDVNLGRAEELSRKTIEKFPDSAIYLDTYAWILFKMGRYDESLHYMDRIGNDKMTDADVLFHYGAVLCKTGDKEKGESFIVKAKELGYGDLDELESVLNACGR